MAKHPRVEYRNSRGLGRARWIRRVTPWWLTSKDRRAMNGLYREARYLRRMGRRVQVDHIVPLHSPYVCGLHVPWNLRLWPEGSNTAKSNSSWPDCPWENQDWIGSDLPEPYQLRLF